MLDFSWEVLQSVGKEKIQTAGISTAKETAYINHQELPSRKILVVRFSLTVNLILRFSSSSQHQQLQLLFCFVFSGLYALMKRSLKEKISHQNQQRFPTGIIFHIMQNYSEMYDLALENIITWVSVQIKFVRFQTVHTQTCYQQSQLDFWHMMFRAPTALLLAQQCSQLLLSILDAAPLIMLEVNQVVQICCSFSLVAKAWQQWTDFSPLSVCPFSFPAHQVIFMLSITDVNLTSRSNLGLCLLQDCSASTISFTWAFLWTWTIRLGMLFAVYKGRNLYISPVKGKMFHG